MNPHPSTFRAKTLHLAVRVVLLAAAVWGCAEWYPGLPRDTAQYPCRVGMELDHRAEVVSGRLPTPKYAAPSNSFLPPRKVSAWAPASGGGHCLCRNTRLPPAHGSATEPFDDEESPGPDTTLLGHCFFKRFGHKREPLCDMLFIAVRTPIEAQPNAPPRRNLVHPFADRRHLFA